MQHEAQINAELAMEVLLAAVPAANVTALAALSAAELAKIDGPTVGVATASKAAILGASKNLDILGLPVGGLKIGAAGAEIAITPTAAEINTLAASGITNADLIKVHALTATAAQLNALAYAQYFKVSPTAAEINAGTKVIVPAISGKQFYPLFCAYVSHTSAAGATLVRLIEETSSGVVMSHVIADLADGVWASITGGTVVTTLLNTALVANKAILIDKTGAALTGTVTMDVVVAGYYL